MNDAKVRELIENGKLLTSVESSLSGLSEIIDTLKDRIENFTGDTSVHINQLKVVKDQYKKLDEKREALLKQRSKLVEELIGENLEIDNSDAVSVIDKTVMNLLKIDDQYIDKYHTSNPSIMEFIETLLKKKKSLI